MYEMLASCPEKDTFLKAMQSNVNKIAGNVEILCFTNGMTNESSTFQEIKLS